MFCALRAKGLLLQGRSRRYSFYPGYAQRIADAYRWIRTLSQHLDCAPLYSSPMGKGYSYYYRIWHGPDRDQMVSVLEELAVSTDKHEA